jgi:acyl-CoA oxidase
MKTNFFLYSMPLSLHAMMFLTTLRNLCDEDQEKIFLQPALRGEIMGCYAQT